MIPFFDKPPLLSSPGKIQGKIRVEKEGVEELLTVTDFERVIGFSYIPDLDFADALILLDLAKRGKRLSQKWTQEQIWLGSYFKKEIVACHLPDVTVRWICPVMGWGVFANRPFKKMEFIAEYTGKVRKRSRHDAKNAYCFEYVLVQGEKTPYTIDAQEQGGIGRFINHSSTPNLATALATFDGLSHVVLYANEPIPKDAQLTFNYGFDYWAHRTAPIEK